MFPDDGPQGLQMVDFRLAPARASRFPRLDFAPRLIQLVAVVRLAILKVRFRPPAASREGLFTTEYAETAFADTESGWKYLTVWAPELNVLD